MKLWQPKTKLGRRLWAATLWGSSGILVLSIVQSIAGTQELTSHGTFGAALRLAMPIMLAGLGAVYSERAGVVNIGLEGMMIMGTWFSAWGAWQFGNPWWGVVFGIIGGAIGGLIHAIATVTFAVDHIVSGVAVNILAVGGMRFLSAVSYAPDSGGGATQSPHVAGIGTFSLPFLAGGNLFGWKSPDFFGWLEAHRWFFLSDIGGLLRGLTGGLSWLTLLALLLVPATIWLLWKTPWGLRLRSCGENPYAAESLGVSVLKMKYYGVIISGAMSGLGGTMLVLVQAGIYREGQTAGRGYIGLAALIFGNWNPAGALAGATLFGFADALRLRSEVAVHALLLFIAVLLLVLVLWLLYRRRWVPAAATGFFAALFFVLYLTVAVVPTQFISFTPHLTTLLVLGLATQRLRMPAADGLRYRKGEAV